jgi:cyanobactin maturation PatA/PatG family protease
MQLLKLERELNISELPGLSALWDKTLGDPDICIAILDGSIDRSHPCFTEAKLSFIETLTSDIPNSGIAFQHGTHVTSVIFGQHNTSVKGIAPRCRGLIIPVFNEIEGALVPCSQLDLARAITQAVEQGANIINISGGQMTESGLADPLLVRAIQLCAEHNVLIVAAAGNDGCQCLHLPAALPTVLAVGAMDAQGLPLAFSNWGNTYQNQGILAPGENILGAVPGGGTTVKSGTSFATPIVSGIVALLLSLQVKSGEPADPQVVRRAMLQSALPCRKPTPEDCRRFLAGSLDIAAVQNKIVKGERTAMPDLNPNKALELAESDSNSKDQAGASTSPLALEPMEIAPTTISLSRQQILAQIPAVTPSSSSISVAPSEGCSCGGGGNMQLVYALGELDYDFGSEARLDYFAQSLFPGNPTRAIPKTNFLTYLSENPWEAQSFNWVLKLDVTPIYAIVPSGPFASVAYERLRSALSDENVERVSIPGYIAGSVRLLSGQIVPAIIPDIRGMYSWSTAALIESLTDVLPTEVSPEQVTERIQGYLDRIYYEYRNLGVTPQERALNFSATNAFQIGEVMSRGVTEDKVLDTIEVEKSPICRPDSDCFDVKLIFFDPENLQRSRTAFRFTIDVNDVIPVSIGEIRHWNLR